MASACGQPVRASATPFRNVTRPSASVLITASPMLASVIRSHSDCFRSASSARWRARRMLWAFCRATERSSSSSSSCRRHQPPPSRSHASAVPSTRARIFANAVSRVVVVSSQNGEKPQSSVVPSCSTGMYWAASRTRSRTSSGVSIRGSIGETTPMKIRWSGFRWRRMIFRTRTRSALAGEGDVEVPDHQLEEAGQQLGVIDVPAVGRVAVAAGAGVDADAPAVLGGEPRQRQVVQVDEAVEELAGRVDLDRQPPFGEVDLDLVRALPQAVADLGLVLAQQVVDELLAGIAGDLVGRVHQAQGRRRDDRLLHRDVGVLQGHVEIVRPRTAGSGTGRRSAAASGAYDRPRTGS